MARLVLNDVPDEIMMRLTKLAEANHRSVEEQAAYLLQEGAIRPDRRDRIAMLESIAALTPKGVKQTDSVEMLREDRSR